MTPVAAFTAEERKVLGGVLFGAGQWWKAFLDRAPYRPASVVFSGRRVEGGGGGPLDLFLQLDVVWGVRKRLNMGIQWSQLCLCVAENIFTLGSSSVNIANIGVDYGATWPFLHLGTGLQFFLLCVFEEWDDVCYHGFRNLLVRDEKEKAIFRTLNFV